MTQQYKHIKEELHNGSQFQQYRPETNDENMSGQKLSNQKTGTDLSHALNLRLGLMVVSIVFTFVLFIVAMTRPFSFVTIFFTLLFVGIMILFNILFTMSAGR